MLYYQENNRWLIFLFTFFIGCADDEKDTKFLSVPGPILFISGKEGQQQLFSMDENGENIQPLTDDPDFPIADARWSPDGKKIALVSYTGGVSLYGPSIYFVNADGSNRIRVTSPKHGLENYATGWSPRWSSDSRWIGFSRTMKPEALGNNDIFIFDTKTNKEVQVTNNSWTDWLADWAPSPHDSMLVWAWGYPNLGLPVVFTFSQINGYQRLVIDTTQLVGNALWNSHNQIVYSAWREDNSRIDLILLDLQTNSRSVLNTPSHKYLNPVSWSPNETDILFNGTDIDLEWNYHSHTYVMNLSTGDVSEISPFPDSTGRTIAVSWGKTN